MQVELSNNDEFESFDENSSDGLYIDRANQLYLHHLHGVSAILSKGGTSTDNFRHFKQDVKKLKAGDTLTIIF